MSDKDSYTKEDVERERAHADHEKQLRVEAEKKLATFKDIDPEVYRAMTTQLEDLKNKAAAGSEDKIKERVTEAVGNEQKRLQKVIDDLTNKADGLGKDLKTERATKVIRLAAADAFGKDTIELLDPIFERESDYEDGVVYFKDAKGNKRYSPKDHTKLLSVEEYIEEKRQQYPTAATSNAQAGSKADVKKISGQINGKQITSLKDLQSQADKGKAYLQQLGQTDPKALRALMSKPN